MLKVQRFFNLHLLRQLHDTQLLKGLRDVLTGDDAVAIRVEQMEHEFLLSLCELTEFNSVV